MKKSDIRMDIDLVAQICGHFTDCETNNGYGCDHPENEDAPRECHRPSCPVAWYDSDKDEMHVTDDAVKKAMIDYWVKQRETYRSAGSDLTLTREPKETNHQ